MVTAYALGSAAGAIPGLEDGDAAFGLRSPPDGHRLPVQGLIRSHSHSLEESLGEACELYAGHIGSRIG